jgi:peptidyl-prolyl cis-trans isomerase NIMA-interacting 1
MTTRMFLALAIGLVAAGCDKSEGPAPLKPPPAVQPDSGAPKPPPDPPPPLPAVPEAEPSRILVQHILVAFKGAERAPATVTRTREEAKKFADELLERVRKGEDIGVLAKQYSTDPGGGRYTLVNDGVAAKRGEIPRGQFIKPFVDLAFRLKVGEAGIVAYDSSKDSMGRQRSPFGFHVIKRLE